MYSPYEVLCLIVGHILLYDIFAFVIIFLCFCFSEKLVKILKNSTLDYKIFKFFNREVVCSYGNFNFKIVYRQSKENKKKYIADFVNVQNGKIIRKNLFCGEWRTVKRQMKKLKKDFNRCAPWVEKFINNQIKENNLDA